MSSFNTIPEEQWSEIIIDGFFVTQFIMFFMCGLFYFYCGNKLLTTREKFVGQKYGMPKNFKKWNQKFDKLTTVFYYYTVFWSCCALPFQCLWETDCLSKINPDGQIVPGYITRLVCPAWFPPGLRFIPWKLILFVFNEVIWLYYAPGLGTGILLLYGFVQLTVHRLEHLVDIMKNINFKDINPEVPMEKLRFCMEYYSRINELLNDVNSIVGLIYAPTQNGTVVLIMGLLEYEIILTWLLISPNIRNPVAVFYLTYFLITEALICFSGQILENACDVLKEQVYDIPWYEMESTMKKHYKLFHTLVQKNLHLKVHPNTNLNMVYYYSVMKGAYSLMMYFMKF
ncbi:hypothetical protein WA026_002811 [Henosepilachna vigintioctopunctata]|uniref:Odorant receptor n=1 Tax=Henosepilachna vigintioctopunctata TaxID=420089 RepID=A0AAW1TSD2_9CUCU